MKRRTTVAIVLLFVSIGGLIFGTCGYIFYHRILHGTDGPEHTFLLPGDGTISDDDAISFSKQVLELDHRFVPGMKPVDLANGQQVNRGEDPHFVTVEWSDQKLTYWLVQLHHKDGRVVGVSYHPM